MFVFLRSAWMFGVWLISVGLGLGGRHLDLPGNSRDRPRVGLGYSYFPENLDFFKKIFLVLLFDLFFRFIDLYEVNIAYDAFIVAELCLDLGYCVDCEPESPIRLDVFDMECGIIISMA